MEEKAVMAKQAGLNMAEQLTSLTKKACYPRGIKAFADLILVLKILLKVFAVQDGPEFHPRH